MKKWDIFISYRRGGGYDTAKHLYDLLTRDGYRTSFDIDTLKDGDFDSQLYERIDQCRDFILIVDQHAFDKCFEQNIPKERDWLRCELAYALEKKKNIIPVLLSGVSGFPEGLPLDIAGVVKKNSPEYNKYYFDDFYRGLKKRFIRSRPSKKMEHAIIFGVLLLISIVVFALYEYGKEQTEVGPDGRDAILSADKIIYIIASPSAELENLIELSNEILKNGSVAVVIPRAIKGGITLESEMKLDTLGRSR